MRVLELFSGSGNVSKAFRDSGHEVFTIDANPKLKPDYSTDLLRWDLEGLPWKPDVIWASPPCPCFSVMAFSTHWDSQGRPKSVNAVRSIGLVLATLEIIDKLKPKYYFIENPVGMLRKMSFMQNHIRVTADYCQYGEKLRKPTDIFTNVENWQPKRCHNGATCHPRTPRGAKEGIQGIPKGMRAIIPKKLAEEIVKVCEAGNKTSKQKKLT